MEHREDPERLADELDREADRMQKRSEELKDEISDVRQDWDRKRKDPGVPGAPEPQQDEET